MEPEEVQAIRHAADLANKIASLNQIAESLGESDNENLAANHIHHAAQALQADLKKIKKTYMEGKVDAAHE